MAVSSDSSDFPKNGSLPVEKLSRSARKAWVNAVRERSRNRCSNCGSTDKLRVRMIVPEKAGGQFVESNGVLLCRVCEMAADSVPDGSKGSDRRLVNFWVSRRFHERIMEAIASRNGFRSVGSLVRYLMSRYIDDEKRFDDLEQYQDSGSEVKLNVWVDRDRYDQFQAMLQNRGITVTDALKSLIRMYELEAGAVVYRRDK